MAIKIPKDEEEEPKKAKLAADKSLPSAAPAPSQETPAPVSSTPIVPTTTAADAMLGTGDTTLARPVVAPRVGSVGLRPMETTAAVPAMRATLPTLRDDGSTAILNRPAANSAGTSDSGFTDLGGGASIGPITSRVTLSPLPSQTALSTPAPAAPAPAPAPAAPAPAAPAPAAPSKKEVTAAEIRATGNFIETPYGVMQATPEQAARFNKSPDMVQVEIDALKKAPYGGKPITEEERKTLPPDEFDKQVKEAYAPITRAEIDARAARIAELEGKRDRIAQENRDERYLTNIEKLRGNRKAVMEADRKNFEDSEAGQRAFEAKWNSPQYRSIIDQPSVVLPEYSGRSTAKVPDWFQSRLDAFEPMARPTASSDVIQKAREMEREQNAVRAEGRRQGRSSSELPPRVSRAGLEEKAGRQIANKQEQVAAAKEAGDVLRKQQEDESNFIAEIRRAMGGKLSPEVQAVIDKRKKEREARQTMEAKPKARTLGAGSRRTLI